MKLFPRKRSHWPHFAWMLRELRWRAGPVALTAAVLSATGANAQTVMQFQTAPWNSYAPTRLLCGELLGANFNATTDQAIPISVPTATYMVDAIAIANPSISLTTAQGGFYSAASKGGVAVVASTQAYTSLTTHAVNTTGNAMLATLAAAGTTTAFNGFGQASQIATLYLSLTTAQGSAATADVRVYCRALY